MVMPLRSTATGPRRRGATGALVLAVTAALPAVAPAADYAARNVAGWTVAVSKDGQGCFVTREFDRNGGTTVLLGLDVDGSNHLSLLNPNWSIKPKEQLKLSYRLSRGGYADHFAVGIRSEGKQGFVSSFEAQFPTYFAASRALHVARGDVPVARLDLTGSGAAVAELRRCVAAQKAGGTAGGKAGSGAGGAPGEAIPKDPFAKESRPER